MNHALPIRYIEPVYRPPSEARSLILPVTDGCSWNRCTFCEMYTSPGKAFRARDEDEVMRSIRETGARLGHSVQRVFLADGDALVLPTRRLLAILEAIRTHMPAVRRIVREASEDDHGMHAIVIGIVNSYPFLHRRSES